MPVLTREVSAAVKEPKSLKSSFAWTFAGNAVHAVSQWAILSLIAKLGSSEMLGWYALAVAITMPVAMLSHLNLRAVLATDVAAKNPFGDYLAVRLVTTFAGVVAIAALALGSGYPWVVAATIMLIGVALAAENVSDLYYGLLQRRERMDQVARSMILRGLLSVAAFGITLWLTRSLPAAAAAFAVARLTTLFAYDRPVGSRGEILARTTRAAQFAIFRTALPLGVVLMLVALTTNLPRYAIEAFRGSSQLGVFAAVASFLAVGNTVMNALGQAATPRLARYFNGGDVTRFRALALKLTALAVLLAAAGVAASALLGRILLVVIYRPEYAEYSGVLIAVMAAGAASYSAIMLGFVLTSARQFAAQMPLIAAAATAAGIASWLLVPIIGLYGAAVAIATAGCVQIAGQLLILRGATRRLEPQS